MVAEAAQDPADGRGEADRRAWTSSARARAASTWPAWCARRSPWTRAASASAGSCGRTRDDVPVTRTVTYRNGGTAPITLSLALTGDSGTFSLAATSVTVPAGGTATTTVTADTRGAGADGFKSGRLVATGTGDVRVETPVAVNREVESYDITLEHVGRDGQPRRARHVVQPARARSSSTTSSAPSRPTRCGCPRASTACSPGSTVKRTSTMLVQPKVVVDGPATVRLDARRGKPVKVTVPRKDATPAMVAINADWVSRGLRASASPQLSDTGDDMFVAQVGPRARQAGFFGSVNAAFAKFDAAGETFDGHPLHLQPRVPAEGRVLQRLHQARAGRRAGHGEVPVRPGGRGRHRPQAQLAQPGRRTSAGGPWACRSGCRPSAPTI